MLSSESFSVGQNWLQLASTIHGNKIYVSLAKASWAGIVTCKISSPGGDYVIHVDTASGPTLQQQHYLYKEAQASKALCNSNLEHPSRNSKQLQAIATMAPALSLLTAPALLLALAALSLWCHPVAAGIVKATKPRLLPSPDKFVELNFFLHNLVRLPNGSATAFFVVDPLDGLPPNGLQGSSLFGGVVVLDDKLTAGPSQSSLEIGRAKGFYVFDSLDAANPSAETVFTAVFNEASGFPGSTILFRGYVLLAPGPLHEFAVAGGTGEFRLARGWAHFTAQSLAPYSASYNITASVYYGGSGRYTYAY